MFITEDPFFKREAEKYANPIPSREFIINHLSKRKKPANCEEIAAELKIEDEYQIEALNRRLRAMKRDGQLVFTSSQCYALPNFIDLLKGTVIGHRDGYGFLRVEGLKYDLYISRNQMKNCIHGDKVLAQKLKSYYSKNRYEARIVRVLVPKIHRIVGRYFTNAGVGFVVPEDNRLSFDILIPNKDAMGASIGLVVVVELSKRPTSRTKAIGKIIEVLGYNINTSIAVNIALLTHEIPYIWPKAVEKQIAGIKYTDEVTETSIIGRVDLRNLPLITIDGEDANDFDDAVYCERQNEGWKLWVAIADVSYYVRPNTPLDVEARNRGISVYFPSKVIPMLPEVLSNGICSLNQQVDRLCMVCEMTISAKGRLTSYKFCEAVINSHARLTYTKVWHMLQGDHNLRDQYAPLVKHIEELHNLYKKLDKAREERGGIYFDSEESKFIFNEECRVERIEHKQRNDAHKLIEECMILANISAARFVENAKEPALFRVHEKPSNEALVSLRSVLAELGMELPGGKNPESHDYAELLESINDSPEHDMLQTMLLSSMKQATYDFKNKSHFGLALPAYAHFTSPIRRYPDLSMHRVIKYLLAMELDGKDKVTATGGWHYSMKDMLELGQHCSMAERRADEATREVLDWLKCDFMQYQVGNIFSGIISSVTSFGFFVRLEEILIDGLVHISSLDDYYRFDHTRQRLIGESGANTYRLGAKVQVRVEAVSMDARKIYFSIISNNGDCQKKNYKKSNNIS